MNQSKRIINDLIRTNKKIRKSNIAIMKIMIKIIKSYYKNKEVITEKEKQDTIVLLDKAYEGIRNSIIEK